MVIIPDPRWVNTGLAAQGSWELLLLFDVFTSWQGVEFKCEVKVQTQGCWGRAKIIIIYPQREEQQEGKGGSLLLILPVNKPITFVLLCCFNERLQDTCTAPSPFLVENCGKCSEPKRTEASWVVFYIYDRGQLWPLNRNLRGFVAKIVGWKSIERSTWELFHNSWEITKVLNFICMKRS